MDSLRNTVVFALDGVLTHMTLDRTRSIERSPRDWGKFNQESKNDKPFEEVIMMLRLLKHNGYYIVIVSARDESYSAKTIEWLNGQKIYCDKLYMRPSKDYFSDRPKLMMKVLKEIGKEKVYCAFDQNKRMVEFWRELGIVCFQVRQEVY